jgi:multiple sugar transport system permease protein
MNQRLRTRTVTKRRMRTTTVLAYLILIGVCLFNLLPFVFMLFTSLKTDQEAYAIPPTFWPKRATLDAYTQIIVWSDFPRYFLNSTIVSLGTALLSTVLGALAGYGFSRFDFRGRGSYMGLILATQMLPGVLLVGPYFKLLSAVGLYNTYLGLILAFTTITLPFSVWMMKGFIDTVPEEMDQAALVDGCTPLGAFVRVVLPVIGPGMVATIVFAFLLAWGDLLWALVLTSSDDMAMVTLGLSRLVTQFRVIWPQLMAGSMIASVPCMVLYLTLQNYLVKGLTAGAVKE